MSESHGKVLVIDDSEIMRDMVRDVLEDAGFRVETAVDGEQGMASIGQFSPEVVLCDMNMPRMNGLQVVEAMQTAAPRTPVLIFTDSEQVNLAVTAMRKGTRICLRVPARPAARASDVPAARS